MVRSYVSESTLERERTGAMAGVSASQALGFIIGPGDWVEVYFKYMCKSHLFCPDYRHICSARNNVPSLDNFRSIVRSMSHVDAHNVWAKVEAQRCSMIFPHHRSAICSLGIFSISGRYPSHAEGMLAYHLQKWLCSYVRVHVATAYHM